MPATILRRCALRVRPSSRVPKHSETRSLPYTPEQMFDLVADVGRYGEFLPWVSAVRVRTNSDTQMVADLIVGFKGLRESFTSKVEKQRPEHIRVDYLEGPLKYLNNDWTFRQDGQGGCHVDFCVDFAFKSRVFEMLAGQVFDRALRKMINAFEERAARLYGDGSASAAPGISSSSAHNAA
jgi:coenzyme Q-binding protein COQ10